METIGTWIWTKSRFNVQLKHNAAKWEFTLDLVSPVKRVGKIPVELLCFALKLGKNYMCCCQIIITGHCWLNKRLASQEERAMIRNNISQNWWIYYRVTKLTAFCSVNHISSLEAWHRYCKWVIDLYFLSPLSLHIWLTPASWGQQVWSPVLDQALMSQESTRSSIRHVFSRWRPRPNWRWPDAAIRVCVASWRCLTTHGFPGQHWVMPLQWRCVHAMGWHWPGGSNVRQSITAWIYSNDAL